MHLRAASPSHGDFTAVIVERSRGRRYREGGAARAFGDAAAGARCGAVGARRYVLQIEADVPGAQVFIDREL